MGESMTPTEGLLLYIAGFTFWTYGVLVPLSIAFQRGLLKLADHVVGKR